MWLGNSAAGNKDWAVEHRIYDELGKCFSYDLMHSEKGMNVINKSCLNRTWLGIALIWKLTKSLAVGRGVNRWLLLLQTELVNDVFLQVGVIKIAYAQKVKNGY